MQPSKIDTYSLLVESSRDIIPEVLAEIFGWVVSCSPLNRDDRDEMVRLMLVCRFWRDVALQTHDLWSRVRVSLATSRRNGNIIAWLSKAGTRRKTLAVTHYNFHKFCPCGNLGAGCSSCYLQRLGLVALLAAGTPLDCLILPTSHPAKFESLARTLAGLALQAGSMTWHSISALTISLSELEYFEERTKISAPVFKFLPAALSSLDLTFSSLYESRYEIPTSTLRKLKSLKIKCDWAVTHITDLLLHCSSVEHLGVTTSNYPPLSHHSLITPSDPTTAGTDSEKELSSLNPIFLAHLRSLDLHMGPIDSAYILRRLRTPNINLLKIQIQNDTVLKFLDALNMPTSSPGKPTIHSLTISAASSYNTGVPPSKIATNTLIDILASLPFLTHLTFHKVPFDAKELLTALRGTYRRVQAAPRLRTIELIDPDDDFDLDALLTYVMLRSSKCRGSDTLRRIELRFSAHSHQCPRLSQVHRDSSLVQDLQSVGVVVDIYRRTDPGSVY